MVQEKINKLQAYCHEHNFDWLLTANFAHDLADSIVYYTLLNNPEHAILLIPQVGRPVLFITPFEVIETQAKFPEIDVRPLCEKFAVLVSKIIPFDKKIAVRTGALPFQAYAALAQAGYVLESVIEIEKIIAIKTDEEIQAMNEVTAMTDLCFAQLISAWSRFRTEKDAARIVSAFALENDVEVSFPTIVASGRHAAHPHHSTKASPLSPGFCVIDMGLRLNGYCSDMTRTVFLGNPTLDEKLFYKRIKNIQERTIAVVAPGIAIGGPDIFCRAELKELNTYFIHGLGHGVGTQVHEWPGVSEKNMDILQPGMVITIEPGIYKENEFGIRLEDDILVTDTGHIVLTKTSKELLVLPLPTE